MAIVREAWSVLARSIRPGRLLLLATGLYAACFQVGSRTDADSFRLILSTRYILSCTSSGSPDVASDGSAAPHLPVCLSENSKPKDLFPSSLAPRPEWPDH